MNRLLSTSPTAWMLGVAASLVGAFMLVYYVQLLQDQVARGSQFRYAQQSATATPPARADATAIALGQLAR